MKLKEKVLQMYVETFGSLHPEAKAQLASGFTVLGAAFALIGLYVTSLNTLIGGGIMTFGVGVIIVARAVFK